MDLNEMAGSLYLCQFSQGTLKIGMARNAVARLASHRAAGIVFGITVIRTDVVPCDSPRKAEKLLIEWCAQHSVACNGREWFEGVNYDACLAAAKSAAAAMMGPHPAKPKKKDILQAIIANFDHGRTKESDLYCEVREMMIQKAVPPGVIAGFDYLHRASEGVRANMRLGASEPKWYDTLNCFELWEIELWFDNGAPSVELLRAAADALGAIDERVKAGGPAYV